MIKNYRQATTPELIAELQDIDARFPVGSAPRRDANYPATHVRSLRRTLQDRALAVACLDCGARAGFVCRADYGCTDATRATLAERTAVEAVAGFLSAHATTDAETIGNVPVDDYSASGAATMREHLAILAEGIDVRRLPSGTEDGYLWYVVRWDAASETWERVSDDAYTRRAAPRRRARHRSSRSTVPTAPPRGILSTLSYALTPTDRCPWTATARTSTR